MVLDGSPLYLAHASLEILVARSISIYLGVWLLPKVQSETCSGAGTLTFVDGEFIKREKNGQMYVEDHHGH